MQNNATKEEDRIKIVSNLELIWQEPIIWPEFAINISHRIICDVVRLEAIKIIAVGFTGCARRSR